MSVEDDFDVAKEEVPVGSVSVAQHEKVKREKARLKTQLGRLEKERERQEELIDQLSVINDTDLDSPTWLKPKKK
ncbi:MAG: hypothetical protein ACWGQW_17600, partial [bacterium]